MSMTHREAQNLIHSARNKAAGKPLQNNTRLYVRGEGPAMEFSVVLHGTEVVTIKPDGTYVLQAGGYHTPTTSDRICTYSPAKLFSVSGQFYLWLEPTKRDPRPDRVERAIPKPYDAVDPGLEPIKSSEGCVAGQMVTTEHVNETVEVYRRDMHDGDEFVEVVRESGMGDDKYDRVKVKRSWNSHVYVSDKGHMGWDQEWANLADNHSPHSNYFVNDDDERVERVQCPHCAEFDAIHERWTRAYHGGDRWGRSSIDQNKGYRMYAEMMQRFGSREAWQDAYLADFRARRAYLKADREWEQRNRVPFYDGITVDSEGYAHRLREKGPSPAKLRRHEAEVKRIKKQINKYVDGFIKALAKGMPMPGVGDCWFCSMFDATPSNDDGERLAKRGTTVEPGNTSRNDHLFEHMKERYYVPSLAVNALRNRGYKDVGIYMLLNMDPDNNTMGGRDAKSYDGVRRDLTTYLSKRLVPEAPTS